MGDIFISYAHKDIQFVDLLARFLELNRFSVWQDHAWLQLGYSFDKGISQAIESCKVLLVLASASSLASDYVRSEYTHALSLKKVVIPVRIDLAVSLPLPIPLNTLQTLDLATPPLNTPLDRLLGALEKEIPRSLDATANMPLPAPRSPLAEAIEAYYQQASAYKAELRLSDLIQHLSQMRYISPADAGRLLKQFYDYEESREQPTDRDRRRDARQSPLDLIDLH